MGCGLVCKALALRIFAGAAALDQPAQGGEAGAGGRRWAEASALSARLVVAFWPLSVLWAVLQGSGMATHLVALSSLPPSAPLCCSERAAAPDQPHGVLGGHARPARHADAGRGELGCAATCSVSYH